jgi:hypothetical protein
MRGVTRTDDPVKAKPAQEGVDVYHVLVATHEDGTIHGAWCQCVRGYAKRAALGSYVLTRAAG